MKKSKLASGLTAAFFGATILSGLFILSFAAPNAHAQSFMGCQKMSNSLGATPNNFKSKLNTTQQRQWIANKCKTTPCAYAPTCVAPKKPPPKPIVTPRPAPAPFPKPVIAPAPAPAPVKVIAPAPAPAPVKPAPVIAPAPAPAAQTCQQMSDATGLDAIGNNGRTSPGRASREEQQRFANMDCQTRPKGAAPASFMGCQQMSDQLGTNEGVTWGRANPAQQQQWTANKCKTRPKTVAPAPPQPVVSQAQMVAEGIKKVDLWEKNTTSQIDKDRLAMLAKIKKEERNYDMMGRRMNSVNEIAKRDMENVRLGAVERRKCFTTEKRSNCFERP